MTDHPLAAVLLADAPRPELRDELMLFGQFEGGWDVDVSWLEDGKVVRREAGEWHFGWILEGRAIQDVWIVPATKRNRGSASRYEYGTSIRVFDASIGAWRSTWIGPVQGSVRSFVAKQQQDEIVLEGALPDGRAIAWIFSDIEQRSFRWRFQVRKETQWHVVQRFECTRMAGR